MQFCATVETACYTANFDRPLNNSAARVLMIDQRWAYCFS